MRIGWLREQQVQDQGLLEALSLKASVCVQLGSFSEADSLVSKGEVHLLIVEGSKLVVEQISAVYPTLPIVSLDEAQSFTADELHISIKELKAESEKIEKITELYHLGQYCRKWVKASTQTEMPSFVEKSFSSLDANLTIDRVLNHFGSRMSCRNIYWIRAERTAEFVDTEKLDLRWGYDFNLTPDLRSWKEAALEEVYSAFKSLELSKETLSKEVPFFDKPLGLETSLMHPVSFQGKILGYVLFDRVEMDEMNVIHQQIEESLEIFSKYMHFSFEYLEVKNLTYIDDLTELHNQRYLPLVLDRELSRAKREDKKFTVLFLDIDYFKIVNDNHGHLAGSQILIEIGPILKDSIRTSDFAFRYGGDEYVMVLTDTDSKGAEVVAERIRKQIEDTTFRVCGVEINITASIGLATYPDHASTSQQILKMADEAMYYGKNKSRNIVYVAS